MGKGDKVQIV
ncbi:hypothetical protein HaLaN_16601, partial [Haematococcus lacustris]